MIQEAIARDSQARALAAEQARLAQRLKKLTPRERGVMKLVVAGKANKQTAAELGVSIKTVEFHRRNLMRKLEIGSVAQLVRLTASQTL